MIGNWRWMALRPSTMIELTFVFAWACIVIPALTDPHLRSILPASWWPLPPVYLITFLWVRPNLVNPRSGQGRIAAVVMVACGIAATLTAPQPSLSPVFLCISSAVVGFAVPLVWANLTVVIHWVVLAIGAARGNVEPQFAAVFCAMVAFCGVVVENSVREFYARQLVASTMADLQEVNSQLADAQGMLAEQSRAEERLRIARDLHDEIGHQLTALSLNLETASHVVQGAGRDQVAGARRMAGDVLRDLRSVVSQLREPAVSFVDRVALLTRGFSNLEITVVGAETVAGVPASTLDVAYRVIQEGLTNAARHAGPARVEVGVEVQDGCLVISVRDDGEGVDVLHPGNGLVGMRERVELVGGTVGWHTEAGAGFRLAVRLPTSPD